MSLPSAAWSWAEVQGSIESGVARATCGAHEQTASAGSRRSPPVATKLANGDWHQDEAQRYCNNTCCPNFQATLQKFKEVIPRMMTCLRCTMFQKSNWKDWSKRLQFFAMHNLLPSAFRRFPAGSRCACSSSSTTRSPRTRSRPGKGHG